MRRYVKYLIGVFGLLLAVWMVILMAQTSGPAINRWTPTADMANARESACSVLLQDGRVMVAGGNSATGPVSAVELYNPNGTFVSGPNMLHARTAASCTSMQDGRVLVAGGNDGVQDLASTEIFDPGAGTWVAGASMSVARSGHGAMLSPWGAVIIAGGMSNGALTDTVEIRATNDTFLSVGTLSSPRRNFAMTSMDRGRILIAGGTGVTGPETSVDVFDSANNTITHVGDMLVPRSQFGAAALLDGTVMLTGGYDAKGNVLASTEIFDASRGESVAGPDMNTPRAGHQAYALAGNGSVLLVGGTDGNNILSATEQYGFWSGRFVQAASLNTARTGQASSQMVRGGLVVAGGKNSHGVLAGSEVYGFATLGTDKADYAPGSTVTMTGQGWKSGERVSINVTAMPADAHNLEFTATVQADAAGRISLAGFKVDESHRGMKFLMTATGSESVAQTTFTDGTTVIVNVTGINPATPATAPVTATFTGSVNPPTAPGTMSLFVDGTATGSTQTLDGVFGGFTFSGISVGVGTHTISVSYSGCTTTTTPSCPALGSYNAAAASFTYTVNGVSTSTTVTPVPANPTYGATVTLTAQVSSSPNTPTSGQGTFNFYDGATLIAGPIAVNASGAGVTTTNSLAFGAHSITAIFVPTPVSSPFLTSTSGTATVNVGAYSPTWTPVIPSGITAGAPITITISGTSAANGAVPPGTMTLTVGAYTQTQTVSNGTASFTIAAGLPAGTPSYTFGYVSSSTNFASNSGAASGTLTVGKATPTVTVTTSPTGSVPYGTGVTYLATVSVPASASASGLTPTGTVTFTDGTNSQAVALVASGTGTATASYTPPSPLQPATVPATITVTGTYGGDANFANPTSGTGTYTITQASSSTAISSSLQTAPLGTTVTYTATVTLTPSSLSGGTVTFSDTTYGNICIGAALTPASAPGPFTATCSHIYDGSSLQYGAGTHTIQAAYNPPAGGKISTSSAQLTETINAQASTTALSVVTAGPYYYGESIQLSATVTPNSVQTPTGTIQFLDGNVGIATCTLSGATCTATIGSSPNTSFAPGSHSLSAKYTPDATSIPIFAASTSTPATALSVAQATTSLTTVGSTANPSVFGTSITLSTTLSVTSTITPGGLYTPATGTITFKDGSSTIGTATVSGTGTYSVSTSTLLATTHTITAVYSGDTNFAGFTTGTALSQVVNVDPTTTALSLSLPGSQYGQPVTLTGTVTPNSPIPSTPTPTQSIIFKDGSSALAGSSTVAIASNTASFTTSALSVATHNLIANYTGDSNYGTSSSGASFTVTQGIVTTNVTPSAGAGTVGTPITLTATLVPTYPTPSGGIAPGGCAVNFTDSKGDTVPAGSFAVGSTTTTVTFTPVSSGTHNITAIYQSCGSDVNYASSNVAGGAASITVGGATTTTTLTSPSSQTVTYGTDVTFNATVAGPKASPAFYSGDTVQFYDGSAAIGTAQAVSGPGNAGVISSFTLANLAPGTHVITAKYIPAAGNTYYATSTSSSATVVVNKATTSTGSVTFATPIPFGTVNEIFNATLAVTSSQSASNPFTVPSGTITFRDGPAGTVLGTATLTSSGAGTYSYTMTSWNASLTGGTHNIVAYYSGDANYQASDTSASTNNLVVSKVSTGTSVTANPATPSSLFQPVTFTGAISGAVSPTAPTGTVTLFVDAVQIGASQPVSSLTFPAFAKMAVGAHTVTVQYSGDTNYAAVTTTAAALTYTVGVDPTTVTVTSNLSAATIGQSVTLTATVVPTYPVPSGQTQQPNGGQITFTDGLTNTAIGLPVTVVNGVATTTWVPGINGNHSITAQYAALTDPNFGSSPVSLPITVSVGGSPTSTTLTASLNSSVYGQPITFTASVAPSGTLQSPPWPTGTIQFYDYNVPLGQGTLSQSGGSTSSTSAASLTVSNLTASTTAHSITAVYVPASGQTVAFGSSTSGAQIVTVGKATTTLATVTSVGPLNYGATQTLSTTLAITSPGATGTTQTGGFNLASGTITFTDTTTSTTVGSVAVNGSGTYSITTSTLGVGNRLIVATYNGDSSYLGANTTAALSLPIGQTVSNAAISSVPAYNSVTPIYVGQTVVFTVTFSTVNSKNLTVGSTANLYDTGSGLSVCPLSIGANNTATCSVAATDTNHLGLGQHTLSVQALTDPVYSLGTVASETLTITITPTTTTLTSTPNPSTPGAAVTFNAKVAVTSPGAGTLGQSGQAVVFTDHTNNDAVLCTSTLDASGNATPCVYTFSTGAQAVHVIYATFSGDTKPPLQLGGSQGLLTQTINKPTPGSNLTLSTNPATQQYYGDPVTLTGTIQGVNSITPAGNLSFTDGSTALGGCKLAAATDPNVATCSLVITPTKLLAIGNHALYTSFAPTDQNYTAVTSAIVNLAIVQANSKISAVTVAPTSTGVYTQTMTFSVSVSPSDANDIGTPTGSVTFTDGTTVLGGAPVTLQTTTGSTTATAQISVSTLALGTRTISATYSGDTNFVAAGPSTAQVQINPASTQTTVTSITPNQASVGQTVTITAKVVALPLATASLFKSTDTITFYDGAVTNPALGTAVIDSTGTATIQVPALAASNFVNGTSGLTGSHTIIAVFSGDANYLTSTGSLGMTIGKVTPTVSVSSSANPSVYYQPVTFTVIVTPPYSGNGAAPTGTMQFFNNGNLLGAASLVANVGFSSATLTLPGTGVNALPVGTNNVIYATFPGDANYNTASSPTTTGGSPAALVQVVNKAATSTALTSNCNACVSTQSVTFTAIVSVTPPGSAGTTAATQPSGSVNFYASTAGTPVAIGPTSGIALVAIQGTSGQPTTYQAALTVTPSQLQGLNLSLTNIQVTAYYTGDGNYINSTSPVWTQALNKATVTLTLTSSQNPSVVGTAVTYSAVVSPIAPASGTPSGQVIFFDGNVNMNGLGASTTGVTLVSGIATFTTTLGVGTHAISAQYAGDANFQPVEAPAISEIVTKIPASIALSSSVTAAIASQPVTFTGVISPSTPTGVASASGQATLVDGSNVIAVGNVVNGIVTFTCPGSSCTGTLGVGNHNLQVVYPGDTNWTNATSPYVTLTVNPAVTTTTLASSQQTSVYGQAVTFTVSTAVAYPGTVPATGTIQLWDNAVALGNAVSINNGSVQITIPVMSVGTHNIIATYTGGISFGSSSSATMTQIVNKAGTTTTLAVNPTSTTSGNQIVLTAVVAVNSPGSGIPTGNVVFTDAASNATLGTVAVSSIGGVLTATLTTSAVNQSSAPRILVATYQGDGSFASSTAQQSETVNGTTIAVLNAASYAGSNFSPDGAAALFVNGIVSTTLVASSLPLPNSLAGVTVTVTDSQGVARQAALYFVSPTQINFLVPTNTAIGLATVVVKNSTNGTASGVILVTNTAPGVFTANQNGLGVAQALFVDVTPTGTATHLNTAAYNASTSAWVAAPLTMTAADTYAIELYGTGLRYAGNGTVTATINGQNATVLYAGAQPQFPGLDQIDLQLPSSLKGAGTVTIVISVNGQAANPITVMIN